MRIKWGFPFWEKGVRAPCAGDCCHCVVTGPWGMAAISILQKLPVSTSCSHASYSLTMPEVKFRLTQMAPRCQYAREQNDSQENPFHEECSKLFNLEKEGPACLFFTNSLDFRVRRILKVCLVHWFQIFLAVESFLKRE